MVPVVLVPPSCPLFGVRCGVIFRALIWCLLSLPPQQQYSDRARTRAKAKQLLVTYGSLLIATGSTVSGGQQPPPNGVSRRVRAGCDSPTRAVYCVLACFPARNTAQSHLVGLDEYYHTFKTNSLSPASPFWMARGEQCGRRGVAPQTCRACFTLAGMEIY